MAEASNNVVLEMMELKKRSEIHWARKTWHILAVSLIAAIFGFLPTKTAFGLVIAMWLVFVPADILRHRFPQLNDVLVHLFRPLMRDSELNRLAGTTYLLTGVLIVAFLFSKDLLILTLLFLAFADPIASLVGIKYGKDKIFGHKSLQGSVAAFVVCAVLTAAYLYSRTLLLDRLVVVSLLGGLIGALAELIPIGKLDDNLTLPVLSASFLYLLFGLFGALS